MVGSNWPISVTFLIAFVICFIAYLDNRRVFRQIFRGSKKTGSPKKAINTFLSLIFYWLSTLRFY